MVSTQYLKKYLMHPHQIWYTEALEHSECQVRTGWPWHHFKGHKGKDQVRISWPWPYFQGQEGNVRWQHIQARFRTLSEEIFEISSPTLVHRSHRARQRPSLNWLTLILFLRSQGNLHFVFAQYLKKYLTEFQQTWYTEASEQGEDQVSTSWPWPYFEVTKVIWNGFRQYLRKCLT